MINLPTIRFDDTKIVEMFNAAQDIIEHYEKNYKTMSIDLLLNLEDKIAVYIAYFGEISAYFNRDNHYAYINRVMTRASKVNKNVMNKDMKITMAKELVEGELKEERMVELDASYNAERTDNLLRALHKMLDVISRRLLHLRHEQKNAEFHSNQSITK